MTKKLRFTFAVLGLSSTTAISMPAIAAGDCEVQSRIRCINNERNGVYMGRWTDLEECVAYEVAMGNCAKTPNFCGGGQYVYVNGIRVCDRQGKY